MYIRACVIGNLLYTIYVLFEVEVFVYLSIYLSIDLSIYLSSFE